MFLNKRLAVCGLRYAATSQIQVPNLEPGTWNLKPETWNLEPETARRSTNIITLELLTAKSLPGIYEHNRK
jgi:hypothetical protein